MTNEESYMKKALSLAARGAGATSPNPMVGALIVKRGKIIATGYHKRAGGNHAEIDALKKAGSGAKGATLYVNLEPCCHFGKTPPCTEAIISAGIRRVVAGMEDPHHKVAGRGFEALKSAGIETLSGILEGDCRKLNEAFVKRMTEGRPFVTLKIAASLDGRTATRLGQSKWITSEISRAYVHKLRSQVDAVMTGAGTVAADNPFLTARTGKVGKQPLRIVADSTLRVPLSANVSGSNTLFVTTERAEGRGIEKLEALGAEVGIFKSVNGRVDMRLVMDYLGSRQLNSILVEAGQELSSTLLELGLVDKVIFFFAPILIGGSAAPGMISGTGIERIADALRIKEIKLKRLGDDLMVEGYVHRDS